MANYYISEDLYKFVHNRAKECCEYCRTCAWLSGIACEIDHIIPRSKGGETTADNLCLACSSCNGSKLAKTTEIDPKTGEPSALFNPRQQNWPEHFAWNEEKTHVIGLTPYGRATVTALQINNPLIVGARTIWVKTGYHPPFE